MFLNIVIFPIPFFAIAFLINVKFDIPFFDTKRWDFSVGSTPIISTFLFLFRSSRKEISSPNPASITTSPSDISSRSIAHPPYSVPRYCMFIVLLLVWIYINYHWKILPSRYHIYHLKFPGDSPPDSFCSVEKCLCPFLKSMILSSLEFLGY